MPNIKNNSNIIYQKLNIYLYNLFIYIFNFILIIISPFNKKIKYIIDGRKQSFEKIKVLDKNKTTYWFHCASLGEFEQARYLIESIKNNDKQDIQILITFFSSSGYEIRKNYKYATCVCYLPLDTEKNAKKFIREVNADKVFIIKYEFWWNYIRFLQNVPLYSVSLILRKQHYLFKKPFKYFLQLLHNFDFLFAQDENTMQLLKNKGFDNVIVAGDTRFDRVFNLNQVNADIDMSFMDKFAENKKLFIAASTWKNDELMIKKALFDNKNRFYFKEKIKLVVVSHEVSPQHSEFLLNLLPSSVLLSEENKKNIAEYDVLIVDKVGILMYLYKCCSFAYIGGGFSKGIHNILEAATYYKPVSFGPNNKKFKEACDLLSIKNAAKQINEPEDLKLWIEKLINDKEFYNQCSKNCGDYVKNNIGATQKIMEKLMNYDNKR